MGSILVALATSLPELATNITAVSLVSPPNPGLAFGNVVGANMLNMFTFAAVALVFGGKIFLEKVAPEQGYLVVTAVVLTSLALIFGAMKLDIAVFKIGLTSLIILVVFVIGMYVVYKTRPAEGGDEEGDDPGMSLGKAWLMFSLVSGGVIVSGFFLGVSTDSIAEITGISSGTLGILLVSLVTTMPEASSTIAAARLGAFDLGVAGLYGSCAFNVTILFYADIFYRGGEVIEGTGIGTDNVAILLNRPQPEHFLAGTVAIVLMLIGLTLILARNRISQLVARAGMSVMVIGYLAAAIGVGYLGSTGGDDDESRRNGGYTESVEREG